MSDPRTFWRLTLAAVAPLSWLILAAAQLVAPDSVRDGDATAFAAVAAHPGRTALAGPFDALFMLTLLPAIVAVLWACRRRAPRPTAWVGAITLLGALAGPFVPTATFADYVAVHKGPCPATVMSLNHGIEATPVSVAALALFLVCVILGGRILLGALLLKARIAPRWVGIVLIVSAPVDVFGPSGLLFHNDNAVISYLMTAIAFGAASRWLLRTPNDEFDLPREAVRQRPVPEAAVSR